ncbi:class I SAM-dependent methyltransferase [Planctomycetota bacterium]
MADREISYQEHNQQQRQYFEARLPQTMVPRDTPYLRRHVAEISRFAEIGPGDRVLEVGCGMGRYTLLFAEQGIRVEGLDLCSALLDQLRDSTAGRYEIPLHCADILDVPAELKEQFDAILGLFTLHHLHDLPACFVAMASLVKPGGTIVFLEPNAYNPLYYLQILISPGMTWRGDGGIAQMRRSVVLGAMEQAGLRDLSLNRFGFLPPTLRNRKWGGLAERALERVPLWRPLLPFQLFRGRKP